MAIFHSYVSLITHIQKTKQNTNVDFKETSYMSYCPGSLKSSYNRVITRIKLGYSVCNPYRSGDIMISHFFDRVIPQNLRNK